MICLQSKIDQVKLVTDSGIKQLFLAYRADKNGAVSPKWSPKPGFLYTIQRSISARINQNWDAWPSGELKKSYKTFLNRPVFCNHNNENYKLARGKVIAARYVEKGADKYIETIIEVDASRFPKLAKEIREGGLDSVSMGVEAGLTICSHCGNKARDEDDFCEHVAHHKGEKLFNPKTGKKEPVHERCYKLSFFELSFVFDPADETAVVSRVIAANRRHAETYQGEGDVEDKSGPFAGPHGSFPVGTEKDKNDAKSVCNMPSVKSKHPGTCEKVERMSAVVPYTQREAELLRWAYGEIEAPEDIDTLRDEDHEDYDDYQFVEPVGGGEEQREHADDQNDEDPFQHYLQSPEELRAPDLSRTKRLDREQEQEGLDRDRRVEDVEDVLPEQQGRTSMARRTAADVGHFMVWEKKQNPFPLHEQADRYAREFGLDPNEAENLHDWLDIVHGPREAFPGYHDSSGERYAVEDVLPEQRGRTSMARRYAANAGERVELHPGLDAWMQGDRYGDVVKVTPTHAHVLMDRSGRTLKIPHERLRSIDQYGGKGTYEASRYYAAEGERESDEDLAEEAIHDIEEYEHGEDDSDDGEDFEEDDSDEESEDEDSDKDDSDEESESDEDDDSDAPPWLHEGQRRRLAYEVTEAEEPPICPERHRHYVTPDFSHRDWQQLMHEKGDEHDPLRGDPTHGSWPAGGHWRSDPMQPTASRNGNHLTSTYKKGRPRKGTPMAVSLAQRGKVAASRGRRYHYADDSGHVDGGPYGVNDSQGEQEEVFLSQVPAAEAVEAPGDDASQISNTPNNLVARLQNAIRYKAADLQRDITAYRRLAENVESPDEHDPALSGTDEQGLKGDFESLDLDDVETQPKDASRHAFAAFDEWLRSTTGRTAAQHGNANYIRRQATSWAKAAGIPLEAMFPTLEKALRQARKTEGGSAMQRRADEKLEVAAPDARIDVEAPVKDVTDADAQASQYDLGDYGHNAGDDVADPDLTTDSQIWAPGEGKSANRMADAVAAVRYAEAHINAGLPYDDKWKLVAQAQTLRHATVVDRTRLMESFAQVLHQERAASKKVTAAVSRGTASGIPPGLARTAATTRTADTDSRVDYGLFI